jgi:hypothetical protein
MAVITASTARAVIQLSYSQLLLYCDTRISRETIQRNFTFGLKCERRMLAGKEPVPYMNEIIRLVFIVGHEPRLSIVQTRQYRGLSLSPDLFWYPESRSVGLNGPNRESSSDFQRA